MGFFLLSSATTLFMPLGSFAEEGPKRTLSYLLASLFWIGLILGFVSLHPIGKRRRQDRQYRTSDPTKKSIGFLRLFSDKPSTVIDSLFFIALLVLILTFLFSQWPRWIASATLFLLLFSAELHGLLTGVNYAYIRFVRDRKQQKA